MLDDFGMARASVVSLLQIVPWRLKIDSKLIGPIEHWEAAAALGLLRCGHREGVGYQDGSGERREVAASRNIEGV